MQRRKTILFIGYLIAALILCPIVQTLLAGERGKIKRLVFTAKKAIEKEDLMRLGSCISFHYQDKYGNDRRNILFLAQRGFRKYQDISLEIKELEIELSESAAGAEIAVTGMARRSGAAEDEHPLEYDEAKLKINFQKEENKWKIVELEFLESPRVFSVGNFMYIS